MTGEGTLLLCTATKHTGALTRHFVFAQCDALTHQFVLCLMEMCGIMKFADVRACVQTRREANR